MTDVSANFSISNQSFNAGFELSENTSFDALFSINAEGAVWGEIDGNIEDQTDLKNALAAKQNTISDLETIRSGASLGTTSIQPNDNISELTNDSGYITKSVNNLDNYTKTSDLGDLALKDTVDYETEITNKPTIPTVNNNTITIKQGTETKGSFTLNQNTDETITLDMGGGASSFADLTGSPYDNSNLSTALNSKQGTLTAGSNITISDDTISATDTTYTAGSGLTLTGTEFSANVVNNVTSSSTVNALSANMGKELQDQITNLKQRGRYLSVWNCTTGLATTEPTVNPYTYKAGDYFIVGFVGTTNYRPNGLTYDKDVASTTVETGSVHVNDTYYFDGTVWSLLATEQVTVAFSTLAGQPYDNSNLASALNSKANESTLTSHTSNTSNPHSVTKAQVGLGNVDNTSDLNKPISTATQTALNGKQATLTAGNNISISNNTISATDTTYTAGVGININNNVISTNAVINQKNTTQGLKEWCGTDNDYANISTKDDDTLYFTFKQIGQILAEFTGYPLEIAYAVAVALVGYKIYGNSKQSLLPSGYTQLEYIESTGTQYINTGITGEVRIVGKGQGVSLTSTSSLIVGSNALGTGGTFFGTISAGTHIGFGVQASTGLSSTLFLDVAEFDLNFVNNGTNTGTVNGESISRTHTVEQGNWYIFSAGNTTYSARYKLHYLQMYQNNTLLRNFIPAKNSSNVIGMYDTVTNTFFTNAGTGTFTAGNVTPSPSAPLEVTSVGDKTANLFDITSLTTYRGYWVSTANGEFVANATYTHTNYMGVKPNTTYFRTNTSTSSVVLYNASKQFISSVVVSGNSFTTPANCYYVVYNVPNSLDYSQGMCVEGSTAPTSYIHYGYKVPMVVNGTTQQTIYLTKPLAKVGTYADYIDYENQQIVRNVGVLELDGVTAGKKATSISSGVLSSKHFYGIYGFLQSPAFSSFIGFRCSHFASSSVAGWASANVNEIVSQGSQANANIFITIDENDTERNTVAGFNTWLAQQYANGTPVTIYYPLATPTTESITLPEITMIEGSNTITTGTSLVPSNAYAKAYVSQE